MLPSTSAGLSSTRGLGGGGLGEDVSNVMAAQGKDTLKDAQLQTDAKRKAAQADATVEAFAAKARGKDLARHVMCVV